VKVFKIGQINIHNVEIIFWVQKCCFAFVCVARINTRILRIYIYKIFFPHFPDLQSDVACASNKKKIQKNKPFWKPYRRDCSKAIRSNCDRWSRPPADPGGRPHTCRSTSRILRTPWLSDSVLCPRSWSIGNRNTPSQCTRTTISRPRSPVGHIHTFSLVDYW